MLAGAAPAAGFSGSLVDRFGRKRLVIAVSILFFLASLATALAPTIAWLIGGRILVGVAIGICSYVGPLYISEIAPAESRGALVSLNQLLITVGILVSYLVDYLLASGEHWRWMFAAAALPAAILGIGMIFMPESPRWLVLKGRYEAAKQILLRVRSGEDEVNEELGIVESMTVDKETSETRIRWRLVLDPQYRAAIVLGIGLAIFQQVTGINTIIYYAPTIFQLAGLGQRLNRFLLPRAWER